MAEGLRFTQDTLLRNLVAAERPLLPQPEAEPDERLPQMPVCKRTHSSTPSSSSISSSDAAAQSSGYPAQAVLVCASSSSSSECSRQ